MRDDFDNVNRYFMPPRLLKKRPSKAKMKRIRRGRRIRIFIALSIIVFAVIYLAVFFTDVGSDFILALAENYASENMNLNLKAESITGNPLKGYTMKNAEVEDLNGKKILSSESLSLYLNLSSLLKGRMILSEIFTQGVSVDAEGAVEILQDMSSKYKAQNINMMHIFESPAFADETEHTNTLHLDRLRMRDGRINSRFLTVNVSRIDADLKNFTAEVDADINGLPLKGKIDMGNDSELVAINRADMNLGSGKITAVGGLFNDDIFDIHATTEDLNLKEVTAMFSEELSSMDFDGTLNLNLDVTGTKEAPRLFGSIDYKGTKIYGIPVERMSANYAYSPSEEVFTMNNIQASLLSIPVQGEISAMNMFEDNAQMRIKLDGSETNLDKLDEVLSIPELKSMKGKVDMFNVSIDGKKNSLNGLVNMTSPAISYMGRTFSNIRMQMKLSGSGTANVEGKFTFEEANGFIQGNIESIMRGSKMNLTAKIADIDIKRIENIIPDYPGYNLEGKVTLSLSVKGSINNPVITGSLSSSEFSVKSQKVMNPAIDFRFEDRTLTIEKTEGTVNGKPLSITGTIKPLPSSNPELDITAEGMRITGALNNPEINLMASSDIKDMKEEIRIESEDMNQNLSIEVSSEVSPDEKMKEEVSKDENTIN